MGSSAFCTGLSVSYMESSVSYGGPVHPVWCFSASYMGLSVSYMESSAF